ncbi:hypothetical protein TRFO_32916 [Tritrichomonas foetus]|uniref:Uncharacterized protein n=1 Tax=Tritrichomonas foetus TaxID=1144522 RepID=A0A1J4JMS2_9EUKA|nr:hypothetical protein TRFO_32916 [Tritrichomonas foetus]|eukprot:OHT00415.1 hypothetical protein TRFO_32916 [Tritrichomonas foetus]
MESTINSYIELQDIIIQLNEENIMSCKAYFSDTDKTHISNHLKQIAHYIYFATIIRQNSIDLIMDLFTFLISISDEENELNMISGYFLDYVFMPPPSKSDITIKNGPISFMRKLYENGIYTIDCIIERIEKFMNQFPKYGNCFLLFFFWFLPEIEEKRSDLYSKTLSMFDSQQLLMFPHIFIKFFRDFENIRADEWKLYKFLINNHYYPSSIEYTISIDDVSGLQVKLQSIPGLRINNDADFRNYLNEKRIENSIFETNYILQNQPTFIQFAIAHNAVKCTAFLLLQQSRLEEHQYQRYPTAHFAVAAENIQMLHKLEQEKCNFNGTLNIAAFYHRREIFDWLNSTMFINLNNIDFDCGPVLHSCIGTENYTVFQIYFEKGMNVNQRDRTKKTILFEAARTNHIDIVAYLLSNPLIQVNSMAVFSVFLSCLF